MTAPEVETRSAPSGFLLLADLEVALSGFFELEALGSADTGAESAFIDFLSATDSERPLIEEDTFGADGIEVA